MVSRAVYIYLSGSNRSSIVITLDHHREIHRDHNRIISQQSASVRDERIGKYPHVPDRPKSGTPIVMIMSHRDPIVDSIGTVLPERIWSYPNVRPDRDRSCQLKFTKRDHITSKRNKACQSVSTRIASYPSLKFPRSSTISHELPIVAIVTSRTTVGTPYYMNKK